MADLNKFYRSKEKIREAINYLLSTQSPDEKVIEKHVKRLKASLDELDKRLKKILNQQSAKPEK